MFMSPRALKLLGVSPRGVLHVGGHEGEESTIYASRGWVPVIWVEMLPDKAQYLREKFAGDSYQTVIEAACWDSETEFTVNRGSNAQASSLLAPARHLALHPEVTFSPSITLKTKRLDSILPSGFKFELLNIDAQGAELRILKGLGDRIKGVRWAYIEINDEEIYEGCALLPEVDAFFRQYGLTRIARVMATRAGWGDALYVRTDDMSALARAFLKFRSWWYYLWGRWRWPLSMRPWDNWR